MGGGGTWERRRGLTCLVASSRVFDRITDDRLRERERESWHKNRKREGESSVCVSRGEAHS